MNLCVPSESADRGLTGLGGSALCVSHSLSGTSRGIQAFSSHGKERGAKRQNRKTEGFLGPRHGISLPSPQPHPIGQSQSDVQNKVKGGKYTSTFSGSRTSQSRGKEYGYSE